MEHAALPSVGSSGIYSGSWQMRLFIESQLRERERSRLGSGMGHDWIVTSPRARFRPGYGCAYFSPS